MSRAVFFSFLLFALALEGCASDPDSPALYVGMSRERLKAQFGEPRRVERTPSGREDWYYPFNSWRDPDAETSGARDVESRSSSVSMKMSNRIQDQPVHLSVDGHVIAPLPAGQLIPATKPYFGFPQVP